MSNQARALRKFDVAAIIVAYKNPSASVRDLISSIRDGGRLNNVSIQIVVVSNTDEDYSNVGADVQLGGFGNQGFARANAVGLSVVDSDFVLLANPDCEGGAEQWAALMTIAIRDEAIVVPKLVRPSGITDTWAYANWTFQFTRIWTLPMSRFVLTRAAGSNIPRGLKAPGAAVCMPTSFARRLGPFDGDFFLYGEDRYMTVRARQMRMPIRLERGVELVHRSGESAEQVPGLVVKAQLDSAIRVARKRYGRIGAVAAALEMTVLALVDMGRGRRGIAAMRRRNVARWAQAKWDAAPLSESSFA